MDGRRPGTRGLVDFAANPWAEDSDIVGALQFVTLSCCEDCRGCMRSGDKYGYRRCVSLHVLLSSRSDGVARVARPPDDLSRFVVRSQSVSTGVGSVEW